MGSFFLRPMYRRTIADYHLKRSSAGLTELRDFSPRNARYVRMGTARGKHDRLWAILEPPPSGKHEAMFVAISAHWHGR